MTEQEFVGWPSIGRLNRDMIVTEKIDGSNAAIVITEDGDFFTQSRKNIITPEKDNFGFSRWAYSNREILESLLGPGRHFGEWFGAGIQRNYGLKNGDKRFALFNAPRWSGVDFSELPEMSTVPVLYAGPFNTDKIESLKEDLSLFGSKAVPGWMDPEGLVIYHTASKSSYKTTYDECDEYGFNGGKGWRG